MNLLFSNCICKKQNDQIIYDVTIQDLDGELLDGQPVPFSYVYGHEPASVIEEYVYSHIDEIKNLAIPDGYSTELPDNRPCSADDDVDEFTKFFDEAQEKIQTINEEKNNTLEGSVEYKNDVFSSSHESFGFITSAISYYDSLISRNEITKESVRQKIISSTNTVHIFNYDQLLELQSLMFKKLNDIYLSANYLKTVALNNCETSDDVNCLSVDLNQTYENETEVDETK